MIPTLMTSVATALDPVIDLRKFLNSARTTNIAPRQMMSLRGTIRKFCALTPYDLSPGMIIFHNGMLQYFKLDHTPRTICRNSQIESINKQEIEVDI